MDTLREEHPDVYFNKLGCINAVHAARKRSVADIDGELEHQWIVGLAAAASLVLLAMRTLVLLLN